MPPVPSAFSEDTSRLISAAKRRQKDLVEFQVPRLQSCKGPLAAQQTLAAELREDIDSFARHVEALDLSVGDQRGEKNRAELRRIVIELQEGLTQLRRDSRTALLASKRNIDAQSKSRRDELLMSSVVNEKREDEKLTDDILMKTNDDVTEALRRTIGLMQGELERSVLSTQMLDQSTASLRATSSTHDTLTSFMGTSKQLITALEKSDWIDRVLIISAFVFFILVVLFIIKQRILDRSLRVALWWTRFLPDFSGDEALLSVQKGTIVLSSTLTSLSSAALVGSASSGSMTLPTQLTTTTTAGAQPSSILDSIGLIITSSMPHSPEHTPISVTPVERTFDGSRHVADEL